MNLPANTSRQDLIRDIVDWDIVNWTKALNYWENSLDFTSDSLECLELGAGGGGVSLWLAIHGNNVICSDLHSPKERVLPLHSKYNCTDKISYEAIDALNIPYENKFDVVIFKSIVGGIAGDEQDHLKKKTIEQMRKALKPGGKLLFAENLRSSFMHMYLRNKYKKREVKWNYWHYNEIDPIFSEFSKVEYKTVGFLGTLGVSEGQRWFLGKIDSLTEWLIPKKYRYIVYGMAVK